MPGGTIRFAIATAAVAAAALGSAATSAAVPTGPCEDVPYIGVCQPLHGDARMPSRHGMGEVVIPNSGNTLQAVG